MVHLAPTYHFYYKNDYGNRILREYTMLAILIEQTRREDYHEEVRDTRMQIHVLNMLINHIAYM